MACECLFPLARRYSNHITLIVINTESISTQESKIECLVENHERNQNKQAIKKILPLSAYPVIFYVFTLFSLDDRIYSSISSNASFELALVHSITTTSWAFYSQVGHLLYTFINSSSSLFLAKCKGHWITMTSV